MILLVTNEQDITSDLVVLRLRERGIAYVRLNTDSFLVHGGLTWRLDEHGSNGALTWKGSVVDLADIDAVWYRRPVAPRPPPEIVDLTARGLAAGEGDASLRNLWPLVPGRWVSEPAAIGAAEPKLRQLVRATQLGLEVPSTLLTDHPAKALEFCRASREVVAKPLGKGIVDDSGGGNRLPIFANLLRQDDVKRLAQVALAPTLFQECVPRHCDVRVTVVGRRIFAAEIHVPKGAEGVDWRREPLSELRHVPHEMPSSLSQRVLELVRSFGLQFSALDFVLTPDGRYVFLELNPNGQWGWIEQLAGLPIADALVDLLSGQAVPL